MKIRDAVRFFLAMVAATALDAIWHAVRHMPAPGEIDHAINVVLCMGYVVLCAVREEKDE